MKCCATRSSGSGCRRRTRREEADTRRACPAVNGEADISLEHRPQGSCNGGCLRTLLRLRSETWGHFKGSSMKTTPVLFALALPFFLASLMGASLDARAKESGGGQHSAHTMDLPVGRHFPSLGGATEWLNSEPLTVAALRGKVVVV